MLGDRLAISNLHTYPIKRETEEALKKCVRALLTMTVASKRRKGERVFFWSTPIEICLAWLSALQTFFLSQGWKLFSPGNRTLYISRVDNFLQKFSIIFCPFKHSIKISWFFQKNVYLLCLHFFLSLGHNVFWQRLFYVNDLF